MVVDERHGDENDIDEQMKTLMSEPFVQRIKDFFSMTLEKIKQEPAKKSEFLSLCRTFDSL